MVLRKRHRSRIEPAVDDLRHAVHLFAALGTLDGKIIYIRSVKFNGKSILSSGKIGKLLSASYRMPVSAFTFPYVKRCSPVTVTRYGPVLDVLKPVAKPSRTYRFGDPVDRIVVSDKVIPYLGHLDIP